MRLFISVVTAAVILTSFESGAQSLAAARPMVQYYRAKDSHAPFSPAVRVGDTLYLSGQVGLLRDGSRPEGIAAQTRAAMDNIKSELALAGAGMDSVFKCTVLLADMSQWADFNKVYVTYFKPERLPARSAFGVNGLALSAGLEVECIAYVGPPQAR